MNEKGTRLDERLVADLVIDLLAEIYKTPPKLVYALRSGITMGSCSDKYKRYMFRKVDGVVQFEIIEADGCNTSVYKLPDHLEVEASKLLNTL